MLGGPVVTTLTQKRTVFPVFSSREVTLGQMRKIGIYFITYRIKSGQCAFKRPAPAVKNNCTHQQLF